MPGRVLKIDVSVDENGTARRNLSELEGGVKKVQSAAVDTSPHIERLNAKFAETEKAVGAAERAVTDIGSSAAIMSSEIALATLGISAIVGIAGVAGTAIYELGSYVKDASEYYIQQSGVLNINRAAVESLHESWDGLKFVIGEVIVGGDGDYRAWVNLVESGLVRIGIQIAADIEFYKQLAKFGRDAAMGGPSVNPLDPGQPPGIDTSERNPDGSLTPFGRMKAQREKLLDPTRGGNDPLGLKNPTMDPMLAEQEANKYLAEQKREQLELEREQKKEAQERARFMAEHVKLENDLTQAINRSKDAYNNEIAAAEKANRARIASLGQSTTDSFLESTMSGDDFKRYQIGQKADRAMADIDPRAGNADQLRRQIEAQRQLQLIQLQQSSQGMTQGISDDLNHFRAQFADVVGQLPLDFQAVIPPILDASKGLKDGLTSDLDAVRGHTDNVTQGFALLQGNLHATKQEIADGLMATDRAYRDAGFMVQMDPDVTRLRRQQTGGIIFSAAGGYVEPSYLARGGPAGTDTVPAFLTPGEGVLSRTGMTALDRLNAGGSIGRGGKTEITLHIDARGAQFSDEASMTRLVERVKNELGVVAERLGMAG